MNNLFLKLLFFYLFAINIYSCKKDDNSSGSAPVITRIRTVAKDSTYSNVSHQITLDSASVYDETRVVAFDSTVTSGSLSNMYAIIGKNLSTVISITLNGVSLYFNSTYVTDTSILFTMPDTTDWNTSTGLVVTTLYGSVSYGFTINQPAPTITSFDPVSGSSGDTVTIIGTYFIDVDSVLFNATPATIISSTATEIQVIVPDGVVTAYIYVITAGGTVKSSSQFGFKYLIYDDQLATDWNADYGWSSTTVLNESSVVKRGSYAIGCTYSSGWGGLQLYNTGSALSLTGYSSLKFSVYGGDGSSTGNVLNVVINSDYSNPQQISIVNGAWTDLSLSLSSFGTISSLTSIVIQEASGTAETIYIDDMGLL
ncbi:MAG: hypothetical protein QM610_13665 [Chitinophagaceae bacterium]